MKIGNADSVTLVRCGSDVPTLTRLHLTEHVAYDVHRESRQMFGETDEDEEAQDDDED